MDPQNRAMTVGILSIATKGYIRYWKQMAISTDSILLPGYKKTFYIFTDDPDALNEFELKNSEIQTIQIESYGWPEATLLRFEIFYPHLNSINDQILMYLDSDMLSRNPVNYQFDITNWQNGIALVSHPGFWRPNGVSRLLMYFRHPLILLKDIKKYITHGSLGAWEKSKDSKAFTERKKRKKYVCGGSWFGTNEAISSMISELMQNVAIDNKNDVVAVWHDESHLNEWASRNPYTLISPSYCFDAIYPWLEGITPIVEAVRKDDVEQLRQVGNQN